MTSTTISTVAVKEQVETFLKAWDNYLIEIKTAFLTEIPHRRKGPSEPLSNKKFNSLKEVDRYFQSYVKPVVERFFKRNPSIRRNSGEPQDIEIYNRYADRCPYLLKPYTVGRPGPASPRILFDRSIESREDIWLFVESCHFGGSGIAEFMEEVIKRWRDYQYLILALVEHDEIAQTVSEIKQDRNGKTKSGAKLKLVLNGSMACWEDRLLPLKGKHFDILRKLAQRPGEVIIHQELYSLINSQYHKDLLLRHYINNIRKAFPAPYNDPNSPEGIIKTRKMEGYYLNLPPEKVVMA